jgi:hypothetical protein
MAYHVKRVGSFKWQVECDNVFEYLTVVTLLIAFSGTVTIFAALLVKALIA